MFVVCSWARLLPSAIWGAFGTFANAERWCPQHRGHRDIWQIPITFPSRISITSPYSNGYGSIPISTIFSGMNIHLPAILGFTRYQGFDPSPNGHFEGDKLGPNMAQFLRCFKDFQTLRDIDDIVLDEGDSHQHIEHTPLTSDKENIHDVLSTVPFHAHTHRMIMNHNHDDTYNIIYI